MKKALAATLTLAALFAFASCSKEPTKINVNDYFKYDLSGITGQGVVTYSIDAEGLLEDNEEALDGCTEKKITNALQGAWDKEAEIANGDEIKFKWDLDTDVIEKKYNVIFEAEDVKVTVKDLEALPELDPFQYLNVTFTGTAPQGVMNVENTLSSAPISGLRFNFDKENNFKNGDVVTVTVTAGSNDATEYCKERGYTLVSDKKEFKVEGLDEYVTTKADLTDDMIKELSKQAEDKFLSSIGDWEATLDSVEYFGYYFVTLKDGVEAGYGHYNNNYLYIILQPKSTNPNETLTYFYYVRFQDIVKKADGTNEIYDIYATAVPEGSYFFGLSGEAFLSEGEDENYCYEGYRNTADLYNAVLRPLSEYYIVDKSFDADVEGTSTAPSAAVDTEATEATEEGETTEETEATEETEETEAEETEETEATEEAA